MAEVDPQPESGASWREEPFSTLVQRMSASIVRHALAVAQLEAERDAAREDARRRDDLIGSLRHDLAAQRRLNAELTRSLALLDDRAVALQHRAQQSELAAAGARHQLDRLLASPSWRLLTPWRAVVRLTRRARHRSMRRQLRRHVDAAWYLARYPEVKACAFDALGHSSRAAPSNDAIPTPPSAPIGISGVIPTSRRPGSIPCLIS